MENDEIEKLRDEETEERNNVLSKLEAEENVSKAITLKFVVAYKTGRVAMLNDLLKE